MIKETGPGAYETQRKTTKKPGFTFPHKLPQGTLYEINSEGADKFYDVEKFD